MLCLLNTGPPFISAGIPPHKKGHKAQNTVSFILYVPWNGEKGSDVHYVFDIVFFESLLYVSTAWLVATE